MSKKYHNPIVKLEKVTIPTWEYASLVKGSTIAMIVKKLVNGLEDYKLRDVLTVLFAEKEEEK